MIPLFYTFQDTLLLSFKYPLFIAIYLFHLFLHCSKHLLRFSKVKPFHLSPFLFYFLYIVFIPPFSQSSRISGIKPLSLVNRVIEICDGNLRSVTADCPDKWPYYWCPSGSDKLRIFFLAFHFLLSVPCLVTSV